MIYLTIIIPKLLETELETMQLSTNLSFEGYMEQMLSVLNQIEFGFDNRDNRILDQILETMVYKLSKYHINWENSSSPRLNLSYDGTLVGVCELILELVKAVLFVIYENIPKITGDLDKHIMRILLFQFSVRLVYRAFNKEVDPALGTVRVENVVATIRHKPVKLYQVMRESQLMFMSANFPDVIIIQQEIDEQLDEFTE